MPFPGSHSKWVAETGFEALITWFPDLGSLHHTLSLYLQGWRELLFTYNATCILVRIPARSV